MKIIHGLCEVIMNIQYQISSKISFLHRFNLSKHSLRSFSRLFDSILKIFRIIPIQMRRRWRRRGCCRPYPLFLTLFFRWRFLGCRHLFLLLSSLCKILEYVLLVLSSSFEKVRIIYLIFSICCYLHFIWIFSLLLLSKILLLFKLYLDWLRMINKAILGRRVIFKVKRVSTIFLRTIELKTIFMISWSFWAFWLVSVVRSLPLRFRGNIEISNTHFTFRNHITLHLIYLGFWAKHWSWWKSVDRLSVYRLILMGRLRNWKLWTLSPFFNSLELSLKFP